MATRKASGDVINAIAPALPELWGGSADLAGVQQHHHRGRAVVPARRPLHQDVERRPASRPGAALRHPRARHGRDHERHRRARRHPGLRRHVPHLLRLHARLGAAGRADGAAGHLRLDPRLDRPRRGRPDPPADRAPRRAAGDPGPRRRPPGGRQRDRRVLADDPRAHRPAGRAGPDAGRTCRSSRAATDGFTDTVQRAPRRLRAARRRRRRPTWSWSAPAPRSSSRSRRASCWPRRASRRGSSRCRAASGSTTRRRPTARP